MNDRPDNSPPAPDGPAPHRRRVRYSGTHPKKFHERYKELNAAAHPEIVAHVRAQGRTPAGSHVPIMVAEVLDALAPRPGDIVADCTLGYGGHAREFLRRLLPGGAARPARMGLSGRLIGLDIDGDQLDRTAARLREEFPGLGCHTQPQPYRGWGCSSESGTPPSCPAPAVPGKTLGCGTPDSENAPENAGKSPGPALTFVRKNFAGLDRVLAEVGLGPDAPGGGGVDIIFADLGVSSMQIDDPARGFSYKHDGPLDMRMDARQTRTAADLLNTLPAEELAAALRDLADEPHADRLAQLIVSRRRNHPFARTLDLVDLVFEAHGLTREQWKRRQKNLRAGDSGSDAKRRVGGSGSGTKRRVGGSGSGAARRQVHPRDSDHSGRAPRSEPHPAARAFQALRILVNDELAAVQQLLRIAPACLRPGGRIGILSFHSGEDRLVKRAFAASQAAGIYAAVAPTPIRPAPQEVHANPRAAPARFRWARKA